MLWTHDGDEYSIPILHRHDVAVCADGHQYKHTNHIIIHRKHMSAVAAAVQSTAWPLHTVAQTHCNSTFSHSHTWILFIEVKVHEYLIPTTHRNHSWLTLYLSMADG